MEPTANVERRAAQVLVAVIEEMLAELAGFTGDGDVGWLRTLSVLSAEVEYSAVRCKSVDSINLVDECGELCGLLAGSGGTEFASRYHAARRASPAIAALHDRALAACRAVATGHAVTPRAA